MIPDQVLVTISLDFEDDLTTRKIEAAVTAIASRAKAAHPEIVSVFIRPQAREAIAP